MSRGEAELPGLCTQFKRQKQDTLWCGTMRVGGSLWSSWEFSSMVYELLTVRFMDQKLTTAARFAN